MPPTTTSKATAMGQTRYRNRPSAEGCGLWTAGEHARFLQALEIYPSGPWRAVAAFVGTRNVRQTMTHAQKHKQKIARHERGLRPKREGTETHNSAKPKRRRAPAAVDIDVDALLPLLLDDAPDTTMPLSVHVPDLKLEDDFVLATPAVADCLDYLMQCYAY